MRNTILTLTLSCIIAISPVAAEPVDADDLVISLVAQHQNGARDADLELGLVEQLEQVAKNHPANWRAQFWAAYFLTQVVMSHPEDKLARLDRAQANLDAAIDRAKVGQDFFESDFLSLQSLVYSFRASAVDEEDRDKFMQLSDQVEHQAFAANPKSPVAMVMAATNIINAGQKSENWDQIMGGHALLLNAKEMFDDEERPRGLTTDFNSEWVRPWVNWVERLYTGGFEAE